MIEHFSYATKFNMLACRFFVVVIDSFYYFVGLVYCMDYLEKNIDWLESKLKPLLKGWLICLGNLYFYISIMKFWYISIYNYDYSILYSV